MCVFLFFRGVMDTQSCLLALLIFFVHIFIIHVQCQPYKYTTQKQACGDKLADIMSLVCSGRGYNVAFIPQGMYIHLKLLVYNNS